MPELPEVETVRRGLKINFGKTIQQGSKVSKDDSYGSRCFCQDLPGQEIRAMGRRGNTFILSDGSGPHLCICGCSCAFLCPMRFLFASMPMSSFI